ncbi:MAG: hypothetical protein OEY52_06185 [Gammaproteobacteria bacterium]|nr:hypothetical protein [Gammaproteobacteria bacterium]
MHVLTKTVFVFFMLLMAEVVAFTMLSGYLHVSFILPWLQSPGLYFNQAGGDIASVIRILIIKQPLLVIESQHLLAGKPIWALHYFSASLLIHGMVAFLLVDILSEEGLDTQLNSIPVTGVVLLLLSSLHMILASCCHEGPNWVVHTWLLSSIFNESAFNIAGNVKFDQLLVFLQIVIGITGLYLIFRHKENRFHIRSLLNLGY